VLMHATKYTPVDALVFGGNFLHSYNIATRALHSFRLHPLSKSYFTELKVREIEISEFNEP
jgi:hypothetical protein